MLLRLNRRGATSSIQNNSVGLRDFQDYPGFTVWEIAKKSLVKCRIVDFVNFDTLPQPLHVPDKHRRRFRTVYTGPEKGLGPVVHSAISRIAAPNALQNTLLWGSERHV